MRNARAAILVLAAVASLAVLLEFAAHLLSLEARRPLIESQVSRAIGREVRIRGSVELGLLPAPHVDASGVSLPGGGGRATIDIETVELRIFAAGLLRGRLDLRSAAFRGVRVRPATGPPGTGADPAAPDTRPRGTMRRVRFQSVEVEEVQVLSASGAPSLLAIESFRLEESAPDGAVLVAARGRLGAWPYEVRGELGPVVDLIDPGRPARVDLEARIAEIGLSLDGTVGAFHGLDGLDLVATAEIEDPRSLLDGAPMGVERLGPLRGSARVVEREGRIAVEDVEIRSLAADAKVGIEVTGGIADLLTASGVEGVLTARAATLDDVTPNLGLPPPLRSIGPVALHAILRGNGPGLGVPSFTLDVGREGGIRARAEGTIEQLLEPRGIGIDVEFDAESAAWLIAAGGHPVPDLGAARGTARIEDRDGTLGIERLAVEGEGPGVHYEVSATFDDLTAGDEIGIEVDVQARDLAALGELFGAELPAVSPARFTGRVEGSAERLSGSGRLRLDQTHFVGEFAARFPPGARPSITSTLSTRRLHLDDVGITPEDPGPSRGLPERRPAVAAAARTSGLSIDPASLRDLDARLLLRADLISGRAGLEVRDSETRVTLDRGVLRLDHSGTADEGGVRATLRADLRTDLPAFDASARLEAVDLTRLVSQFRRQHDTAGLLDGEIELSTRGLSTDALRRNLSGHLRLRVREGTLASEYAQAFVRELVKVSMPSLGRPPRIERTCMACALHIENGVAEVSTLVLEGARASVRGRGEIDVAEGTLDLLLEPRAHDPAIVSVAPQVAVSGPVTAPIFTPVPRSLATSFLRGLVQNARRPAEGLLSRIRGGPGEDVNACAKEPSAADSEAATTP